MSAAYKPRGVVNPPGLSRQSSLHFDTRCRDAAKVDRTHRCRLTSYGRGNDARNVRRCIEVVIMAEFNPENVLVEHHYVLMSFVTT